LAWDLKYTILPDPVFRNRLAADRLVFILGISYLLLLSPEKNRWREHSARLRARARLPGIIAALIRLKRPAWQLFLGCC
jgi:hypothetical protein